MSVWIVGNRVFESRLDVVRTFPTINKLQMQYSHQSANSFHIVVCIVFAIYSDCHLSAAENSIDFTSFPFLLDIIIPLVQSQKLFCFLSTYSKGSLSGWCRHIFLYVSFAGFAVGVDSVRDADCQAILICI